MVRFRFHFYCTVHKYSRAIVAVNEIKSLNRPKWRQVSVFLVLRLLSPYFSSHLLWHRHEPIQVASCDCWCCWYFAWFATDSHATVVGAVLVRMSTQPSHSEPVCDWLHYLYRPCSYDQLTIRAYLLVSHSTDLSVVFLLNKIPFVENGYRRLELEPIHGHRQLARPFRAPS